MEDGFFWIVTAALAIAMCGGGIAMALVRDGALDDEEQERPQLAPRRNYSEQARDGAR